MTAKQAVSLRFWIVAMSALMLSLTVKAACDPSLDREIIFTHYLGQCTSTSNCTNLSCATAPACSATATATEGVPTYFTGGNKYAFCLCAHTGQSCPPPGREEWASSLVSSSYDASPNPNCTKVSGIGTGPDDKFNNPCGTGKNYPCYKAGDNYYREMVTWIAPQTRSNYALNFAIFGTADCTIDSTLACTSIPPACSTATGFVAAPVPPPPMIYRREIR
jgi:hypothetical protein